MNDPHASGHPDPQLAMVECRLERAAKPAPAPQLRHRVLMAVDDVLSKRQPRAGDDPSRMIPRWLWAAAVAAGVAIVIPVFAAASSLGRLQPLSFVDRLQAAGLGDEESLAAAAGPAVIAGTPPRSPQTDVTKTALPLLRGSEIRRLLQETL